MEFELTFSKENVYEIRLFPRPGAERSFLAAFDEISGPVNVTVERDRSRKYYPNSDPVKKVTLTRRPSTKEEESEGRKVGTALTAYEALPWPPPNYEGSLTKIEFMKELIEFLLDAYVPPNSRAALVVHARKWLAGELDTSV